MHDAIVTLAPPNPWIDLAALGFIGLGWILFFLTDGGTDSACAGLTKPSGKGKESE